MKRFFITGSGTEVGKTLVTAAFCYQFRQSEITVGALKPLITGYEADSHWLPRDTDTATIINAMGKRIDQYLVDRISPWRYRDALAPNMAAEREGKALPSVEELVDFCRESEKSELDVLLVEGVGGVMAPISNETTVLDWMVALDYPVVLVVGSYLGAISHALTAYELIKTRGLSTVLVVVSESAESTVSLMDTSQTIARFIDSPMLTIPRLEETKDEVIWQQVPDLLAMLHSGLKKEAA